MVSPEEITQLLARAQQLRREKVLTVEKQQRYTTRDRTEPGRLSLVLSIRLRAESYLFIGSGAVAPHLGRLAEEILTRHKRELARLQLRSFTPEEIEKTQVAGKSLAQLLSSIKIAQLPVEYRLHGRDVVVIPGSSIKGAVRHRLELAFKPVDNNRIHSCYVRQESRIEDWQKSWRYIYIYGPEVVVYRSTTCDVTTGDVRVCKVCDIMGTAGLASRVDFSDALPVTVFEPEELTLEYGERILAIPPGTEFSLQISMRNVGIDEIGLVLMALNLHTGNPILIGRFKYKYKTERTQNRRLVFGRVRFLRETLEVLIPRFVVRIPETRHVLEELGVPLGDSDLTLSSTEAMRFADMCIAKAREVYADVLKPEFLSGELDNIILRRLDKAGSTEYHV